MTSENTVNKQIDDIDIDIIERLQKDPNLTHSMLAKQLNRSQPAIGARVKKLTDLGLLCTQIGVDFQKNQEFHFVRVDMNTTRAEDIMEMGMCCPFVMNVFKTTGEYNISLLIAASEYKQIDHILNRHFRQKAYVKSIQVSRINDIGRKCILPMDLRADIKALNKEDPCGENPICRDIRAAAKLRTPEQLNLI